MTPEEKAARKAAWDAAHPFGYPHDDHPANEKEAKFLQAVMEGRPHAKAYQEFHPNAIPKTCAEGASKTLAKPRTRAFLNEAQKARARATGIDTAWAVEEFIEVYYECRENGDTKNALRALETIVKHTGGFEKGGDNGGSKPPIQINVVYHQRPSELPSVTVVEALPDGNRNGS